MKISVIGIGPGAPDMMTGRALETLRACDVLAGYKVYVDLVRPLFPDKPTITTAMRGEEERCRLAVEAAREGRHVAMVCSGDAGVYGMAGLVLTTAQGTGVEVEVLPGITAACSGGALLGAPLTHDFAVISLSDLLTPWELIQKRVRCAAQADFSICLYNPMSHKRTDYLRAACDIILEYRRPETVCGLARNIGREGEETAVLTLDELRDTTVDMFTTVFIGNSNTRVVDGRMVTPRGYKSEGTH